MMQRFLLTSIIVLGLSVPALAQDGSDPYAQYTGDSIINRLTRLEKELDTLSRQVYRGGNAGTAQGYGRSSGSGYNPNEQSTIANVELRQSQAEAQMRALTGKVEQVSFAVSRLREQLNRLTTDIEYRLRALEQGQGQGHGQGTAASQPAPTAPEINVPQRRTLIPAQPVVPMEQSQPAPPAQASTPARATPDADMSPDALYEEAFTRMSAGNYRQAEQLFSQFIDQFPHHKYADNAYYWRAETYFVQGESEKAAIGFAEGYQKFPDGNKAADNLLKLSISLGQLGRTGDACRAIAELNNRFPDAASSILRRAKAEADRMGCQG